MLASSGSAYTAPQKNPAALTKQVHGPTVLVRASGTRPGEGHKHAHLNTS